MWRRRLRLLNCINAMQRRNKLLIGLIVAMVVLIGVTFVMPIIEGEYFTEEWMILLSYGTPYLLCLGVALAMQPYSKMRIPTLRPKFSRYSAFFTLWGVILMFAAQIVMSPVVHLIPDAYIKYIVENQSVLQQSGFYPQLMAIFILPILQEWTFRGIFQNNIETRFGALWAIFISAAIYAVTFLSPREIVYMFGSGTALAAIYYVTRSLSTVIWIHILFNGINYLFFLLFDTSLSWYDILYYDLITYVSVWTICTLLVILTVWWVSVHHDKRLFKRNFEKK